MLHNSIHTAFTLSDRKGLKDLFLTAFIMIVSLRHFDRCLTHHTAVMSQKLRSYQMGLLPPLPPHPHTRTINWKVTKYPSNCAEKKNALQGPEPNTNYRTGGGVIDPARFWKRRNVAKSGKWQSKSVASFRENTRVICSGGQ